MIGISGKVEGAGARLPMTTKAQNIPIGSAQIASMTTALGKYVWLAAWLVAGAAGAKELEIGQRVAVVRDRVAVMAGSETVDVVFRGDVLTVANLRQGWILVGRGHTGWLDGAAVLPVEAALEQFNKVVSQNPLDSGARAARAAIWVEQRFWDAAIAEATEALRQNPRLLNAWCVRSAAQRGKKNFDAAQADAQAAIGLCRRFRTDSWPRATPGATKVSISAR